MLVRHQHAGEEEENDAPADHSAYSRKHHHNRGHKSAVARQQVSRRAKPAEKNHDRERIPPGNGYGPVCSIEPPGPMRNVWRMGGMRNVNMRNVGQVRHVRLVDAPEVAHTAQKRKRTQKQSRHKADQIKRCPGHLCAPCFLPRPSCETAPRRRSPWSLVPSVPAPCFRSTSASRGASPGVSRIASSSSRHSRECSFRASVSSACFSSGSRRNLSAPDTSHRSSLSSTLRSSLCSSGEYPSGSSTR